MIKEYIQFAIDNNLNYDWYFAYRTDWVPLDISIPLNQVKEFKDREWWWVYIRYDNLIELITSLDFIEAIARGYVENNNPTNYWEVEWIGKYKSEHWGLNTYDEIFEQITILQAIAIRDEKLEEFITNLLWSQK